MPACLCGQSRCRPASQPAGQQNPSTACGTGPLQTGRPVRAAGWLGPALRCNVAKTRLCALPNYRRCAGLHPTLLLTTTPHPLKLTQHHHHHPPFNLHPPSLLTPTPALPGHAASPPTLPARCWCTALAGRWCRCCGTARCRRGWRRPCGARWLRSRPRREGSAPLHIQTGSTALRPHSPQHHFCPTRPALTPPPPPVFSSGALQMEGVVVHHHQLAAAARQAQSCAGTQWTACCPWPRRNVRSAPVAAQLAASPPATPPPLPRPAFPSRLKRPNALSFQRPRSTTCPLVPFAATCCRASCSPFTAVHWMLFAASWLLPRPWKASAVAPADPLPPPLKPLLGTPAAVLH